MKINYYITGLLAFNFISNVYSADPPISCQQQSSIGKGYTCTPNDCPIGFRSVFWDEGCLSANHKCCI